MEPTIFRIAALIVGLVAALAWFQFSTWRRKRVTARRATEAGEKIDYWNRPARTPSPSKPA
ncbi:MAG TPA: hypothetical protein VG942_03015 [Hyphomonadaceae bacterium]|nr:hypothetical protein [Hyphomonadaceae bacterium]